MSQLVDDSTTFQESWFDEFVHHLRTIQMQLETNTADLEIKSFFENVFVGNIDEMARISKETSQKYFVPKIIVDYLQLVGKSLFDNLSFDYNDSEVLVWAVIEDDREDLEKELIIAEAKINAKYHPYGYTMNTTIVEESDCYNTPNHYMSLNVNP